MTHTSTEQPEALRLAAALDDGHCGLGAVLSPAAQELRRLHARVQELEEELEQAKASVSGLKKRSDDWKWRALNAEESQAREPLSDEQIEAAFKAAGGRWADSSYWVIEDADLHPFVRGITQEKQG